MKRVALASLIAALLICSPIQAGELSKSKQAALAAVDSLAPEIGELALELWHHPEIALKESRSAATLIESLEKHSFAVERGVAGLETAFVASWGEGKPVIGILAEFDALPGIGNAIVPRREARSDGVTAGHGCGHNLFGAASVGAAIALAQVMESQGLSGTVRLLGTPAEETVVGKVVMAKEGVFDDLDAALDWHPGTDTEVKNQPGRALNSFTVEFFGQAAHSAADPWNGRSALDAVELMNYGANLYREHIPPTTRIHYVIPGAGDAPNVVPEYAKVWYYVRDANRSEVEKRYERLLKIAEGAAMSTGTTHKIHLITGVHEYRLNRPLQEAAQTNLEIVGPVTYSEDELAFAHEMQRFLEVEEKGFDNEIKPLADEPQPTKGGSTDAAEVSHITPTVGFSVTTAVAEIPWHSWAATACHGTTAGIKGAVNAAKVLALTGVDLLTDPGLLEAAKKDFAERSNGVPYRSPLGD